MTCVFTKIVALASTEAFLHELPAAEEDEKKQVTPAVDDKDPVGLIHQNSGIIAF